MRFVRSIAFIASALALLIAASTVLRADPCLVVYTSGPCVYHYDPAEYYTVGPDDPLYDPMYDRGGKMLLEIGTNEVDLSIYQASGLSGFAATYDGCEGYFIDGTSFTLIIDGFSNEPTIYTNILVMFDLFTPNGCTPQISASGSPVTGGVYSAGDLVVSTPTADGNNYSNTKMVDVSWRGCAGLRVWAFADENYDGLQNGGECFTAYSHDLTIPVKGSTWGAIKELFR